MCGTLGTVPYTGAGKPPAAHGPASDRMPRISVPGVRWGGQWTPSVSPRILYVDDNPDLTDSAVELLRLSGYEAVASYGGPQALDVARFRT